jgi:hypothetical protein
VVECGELGVDGVEVAEHVGERTLGERIVERLTPDPGLVSLGPGLLALAVDAAVAQQLLGQLVAGGGPRPAQVIAAADQIPQPLLLGGGRLDERQLAGAIETHDLLGVATVGLDPVTGPDGHKRRRDHVAGDADPPKQPEKVIAARARLVGDGQPIGPTEPVDEPAHRALGVLEPGDLRRASRCPQHARHERVLVHVEHDPLVDIGRRDRANVRHGLVLLRMRHWPQRSMTTATLTRDRCERRGPARLGVHTD